ncbi:enhanced level of genomic instability 1 isoform X2 [Bicyclus anynana]|nr:enhanced level of genomic instability 1 isoform X2 [Bicyclus anynana]XP_052741710.1 enhanced level of genomic instability 1 isoform X2 [Bicyclus anynana]
MVRKKKMSADVDTVVIGEDKVKIQNGERTVPISLDEVGDKKHMDAFKLMMDSRNKSIGSNSPGKDKVDEPETNGITERKEIKAKRILSLQKMALSKGSGKNKEIEEYRDKSIEKKMVKRAERLKQLISKTESKGALKINISSHKETQTLKDNSDLNSKLKKSKSLKLCDIFNETTEVFEQNKISKSIAQDDIEFLNKLAPSIKKKENMLSYFQKMPKDSEQLEDNASVKKNNKPVIKVKLNSKHKKKTKILKSTEDDNTATDTVENIMVSNGNSNETHTSKHKRFKRKRNLNLDEASSPPLNTTDLNSSNSEGRPKRNVKKPLKYTEDVQIFSSDEELHIITPKKKKSNIKSCDFNVVNTILKAENVDVKKDIIDLVSNDPVVELPKINESRKKLSLKKKIAIKPNSDKKAVKLAPIFVPKMQLSPADIEAKQKFLQSGVPEKLKKKAQNSASVITFETFPSVVHIQQGTQDTNLHQEKNWFNISMGTDEISFTQNDCSFKNLLMLEKACNFNVPVVSKYNPEKILKSIKCAYPKFPVYRTYNLMCGKKKGDIKDFSYSEIDNSIEIINGQCAEINYENPDQLNWCDKYKPTSSKQIIGNFESIKELKKWLETWTENLFKAKQNASDSSDFSDFYHSDTDSRDGNRSTNNVLILTGKTGSGKTSSVYAVASELAIKVIEVNSSSKRTGKIMLQDLHEATQSHKVDRAKSGSENSQKLQEDISVIPKKRGRPKTIQNGKPSTKSKLKPSQPKISENQSQTLSSQESARTGMSLILIDDADIVFEQDDGFCSAVAQLIQSSKRPVILVTSSLTCPHLQKFIQYGKILHMRPVLSRMLGTWLDIMCLVDVGKCCMGLGAKMLDFYKGDKRKTINCLQFYMNSNKNVNKDHEVALSQYKSKIDDEDSSMSWVDSESSEAAISNGTEEDLYIHKQLQLLHVGYPTNMFNIWWNLPAIYKDYNNSEENDKDGSLLKVDIDKKHSTESLNKIAHVLDTISVIDYFDSNNPDSGTNVSTRPWYTSENASLLENENFECYNKSSLDTKAISDELINCTITAARRSFKHENSLNLLTSNMSAQRQRDKTVSRHNKLSSYLHPSSMLDHRATALDYWPICRAICRIEKNRTDVIVKRKNRFCHYLKSLNVLAKNDFFDSLADSLT